MSIVGFLLMATVWESGIELTLLAPGVSQSVMTSVDKVGQRVPLTDNKCLLSFVTRDACVNHTLWTYYIEQGPALLLQ